jgi:hypothetical protein
MLRRLVFFVLIVAAPLCAQLTTGQISGTVRDSSSGAVPGAAVHVVSEETALDRAANTDKDGRYTVTNLAVGGYTVKVDVAGFKSFVHAGIQLTAGERIEINPRLEVGQVNESVTVTAAGETVETESGTVGSLIDGSQARDLSLNGRNIAQLLMLLPGVVSGTDQFDRGSIAFGGVGDFYVNGTRSTSNAVTVDGGFNQDSGNIVSMTNNVGVDFVQQVKVQASSYSAEYGRNGGGQINFVTRGGTTKYHGTLFEFLRNDKLNARSFFAPNIEKLRLNNFGWNIGGPIQLPWRPVSQKKLFFFAGQEYKRRVDGQTVRDTFPTTGERSGIINTTATLRYPSNFPVADLRGQPVADPSRATAANPTGRNILPRQYMTANGLAMMKIYDVMQQQSALYTDVAGANNITFQNPNADIRREDIARLDYQPSGRNQFTGRILYDTGSNSVPYETGNVPTFRATRRNKASNLQLSWTRVQSTRTINELAAVSNYLNLERIPYGEFARPQTYGLNIQEIYGNEMNIYGIPSIAIAGYTTIPGARANPRSPVWDFSVRDNLTHIQGAHQLKTGILLIRDRKNERTNATLTGALAFNPSGNIYSTGNALMDALLGNYYTYVESDVDKTNRNRFSQFEGYVADTWKARRNLTLDIGARYYLMTPPHLVDNTASTFLPDRFDPKQAQTVIPTGANAGELAPGVGKPLNGIAIAGQNGMPDGFYQTQNKISPRFGFAYDPFGHGDFAIRGGAAIYYDRLPAGDLATAGGNPPFVNTYTLYNASVENLSGGRAAQFPVAVTSYRPSVVAPATYNWNFGIQKKLPAKTLLDLNYVATQGRHLLRQVNINIIDPATQFRNSSLNQNAIRPYSGYTNITLWQSSSASNYHGLQTSISRRYASRLTYSFAYTFSKVLTDASDKNGAPENPNDLRREKSHATYDRNHVFVASYLYKLPFFGKSTGWMRTALAGWELSGITQMQAGAWLSPAFSTPTGTRRPDRVGDVQYLNPRTVQTLTAGNNQKVAGNFYFDPTPGTTFVAPANDKYGNSAPYVVRGPGRNNFDLSLFKVIRVAEGKSFQFRAEAFNAWNHASFRNPNMTASGRDYGTISDAGPPRLLQMGLKFLF